MCQGSVTYTWDAAGRRSTLMVAGQPQITYGFDAGDRLTTITQGTSQVGLSYDAAGRRATLTLPNGIVASYSYDNANQLTGISYAQGTTLGDLTYVYDDAGRRIQMGGSLARTNLPQALTSATYDEANRLINWAGTAHSYDANGNLTADGAKTYTWNSRNRLTSLSGAASASFAYDGLGRRTGKTVFGTTTNFLYDGLNPVQELTGTTPKANLLTGLGIDESFARTDSAGTRSYLTDALGSTLALTDGSGAIQTSYTYAPYGETTVSGAANGNALQYTGRENDGTGLYYYRARYYDPVKGRFAAVDPIGLAGGINQYAYVEGNPISASDPSGLDSIIIAGGGSLIVGGGIAGSGGFYISNKPFDIGIIGQGEYGLGVDVGLSWKVGYQTGSIESLSDPSINYNLSPVGITVTAQYDARTGELQGGSIGPAIRAAGSRTYSQAGTYGLRDLFGLLFDRYGYLVDRVYSRMGDLFCK